MDAPVKKVPRHYVDNKKFYTAIIKYKQDVKHAEEHGLEKPRIPNYVGECLLNIANRLSTRPNFVNYPFREEMVSDGIENCLQYFDNFNPEKTSNPFSYFTQIIYYAFLRRIHKEKRQLYVKYKTLQNLHVMGMLAAQGDVEDAKSVDFISANNEYMDNLVKSIESKMKVKKEPKPKTIMRKFYDKE